MIAKIGEKIGGSGVFLTGVIVVYLILGVVDFELARNTLHVLWTVILRILPILILVFGIMFLANLFFEARNIVKILGKGSGFRGWAFAISGGIISSGPIYLWYPLLSDLKERGMKDSLIAAFLYNRAIKIPLIPMMVSYFGWPFTVTLFIYLILFSIVNGLAVEKCAQRGNQ